MNDLQKTNEFRIARELSRAITGLNSLELRVLFSFFALREKEELEFEITYQELMELLKIKRGTKADSRMKTAMRALRRKTDITIPQELSRTGNEIDCDIINEVEWVKGDKSRAIVRFSDKVTPLLDNLKSNYDFYLLSQMALFTSSDYSGLIYQFCTSILPLKEKSINYTWWLDKTENNPDSFREWTGTLKKYPEWYELRRWAIDPAIKEINEKSDINIAYTPKKKGKSVVGLNLTVARKKKVSIPPELIEPPVTPDPEPIIEEEDLPEYEETTLEDYLNMSPYDQRLDLLAEACGREFDKDKMELIYMIINQKEFPDQIGGRDAAMHDYLVRMYKTLNLAEKRKQEKGEKISNRFTYFTAILKKDCGVV